MLEVATEYNPDTGRPYYREIFVTTPRQSGKTTLILVLLLTHLSMLGWVGAVWTGQDGKSIRKKWIKEIWPRITRSEFAPMCERFRKSNGDEGLDLNNGSYCDLLGSSKEAGHGSTLDGAVLDEIWADTDSRREAALRPAMITNDHAQLLVCSTAGTQGSTVYLAKQRQGRAAVLADEDDGMCYFEWSAPGDGWDPDDEDSWWEFMPALGHTISVEAIRAERKALSEQHGEFERAYGNLTQNEIGFVIDPNLWRNVCTNEAAPDYRKTTIAVEVDRDRSEATIVGCDINGHVELIDYRPGTGWVMARLEELTTKYSGMVCLYDAGGPAAALEGLADAAWSRDQTSRDCMKACGMFYDAIEEQICLVRPDVALDLAVEGAAKKKFADAFVWDRDRSSKPVEPLMAASLAYFGARAGAARQAFVV